MSSVKAGAAARRASPCSEPRPMWLHTLIPRETARWKVLSTGAGCRGAGVRPLEARMGAAAPSGAENRAGGAHADLTIPSRLPVALAVGEDIAPTGVRHRRWPSPAAPRPSALGCRPTSSVPSRGGPIPSALSAQCSSVRHWSPTWPIRRTSHRETTGPALREGAAPHGVDRSPADGTRRCSTTAAEPPRRTRTPS